MRPGAVLGAAAVAAALVAGAAPAAGAPATTTRLAGADRYGTAAAIATRAYPSHASVAYVATGEDFPDALAAGPVATRAGGPVLLTRRDAVPGDTVEALRRLAPSTIVVLGGPAAVSDAVVARLRLETNGTVSRAAGADRYATAAAVSASAYPAGVDTVYVATGITFPDALAGGAAAASSGAPVLLTKPDTIPAATADELRRLRPRRIVVLGGHIAVSPSVEDGLRAHAAIVRRVAGIDRYGTAVAVSTDAFPDGAADAFVATGTAFPDATTGASLAGRRRGPLLLVRRECMTAETGDEIDRLEATGLTIFGGVNAVGSGAERGVPCE